MKDRPILFSAPMVRAILAGKKTMTRRVWKARFKNWKVGDRLWVRETYCTYLADKTDGGEDWDYDNEKIAYRADADPEIEAMLQYGREVPEENYVSRWTPSIFMPRKYSRILLEITELKRERLQDISEADAEREGASTNGNAYTFKRGFWHIWERINGRASWYQNPEVVAIGFKVLEAER